MERLVDKVREKEFFAGFYCKLQTRKGQTLALIPSCTRSEAFLQVVMPEKAYSVPYPRGAYHKANPVWLGENRFSMAGVRLAVDAPGLQISGCVRFISPTPLAYDIMGPFALLPMECRHTVRSMRHWLAGGLWVNGEWLDFTGGRGYMEGDSGTSFPKSYTWAQCNYFTRDASVMASAALIPTGPLRFWGAIAVVQLEGVQYRIGTYFGAKITRRTPGLLELKQGDWTLYIEVPGHRGQPLAAPQNGGMVRTIHESPATGARFVFTRAGEVLLDEWSEAASYEYVK